MKKLRYLFVFIVVLPLCLSAQQLNDSRVLLQGFYWNAQDNTAGWYNIVKAKAPEISAAGIDMIWLPPPSNAGSAQGYLPRELNNFSNSYGNAIQHKQMLDELLANNIEAIADIVINHRVGNSNWINFTNPTWDSGSITADDEVWSQPSYSGVYPRGNYDSGSGYEAARDIDHTKEWVRTSIKEWLNNLKAFGYDGWRYDFVHGFAAQYISEYNSASSASFSVGEDWKGKQEIQDWVDASGSTAFDFTTYYLLKDAIKNGNYGGLNAYGTPGGGIGWDPSKYTTFIENHDTPRYDPGNYILTSANVGQAYAYLLTHPGVPTIYWPHYFDWGVKSDIDAILAVRKANGITSTSVVDIKKAEYNLYAAVVDGKVAMKIGGGNWSPSSAGLAGTWDLEASGNNYAIWVKAGSTNPNPGTNLTIHFYNNSNWSNPTMYFWAHNGTAAIPAWPGVAMQNDGNGWYSYTIAGASFSNIIFSNSGASQSPDLTRSGDGWYKNGTWSATNPDDSNPNPNPTGLEIHYFNSANWSSPKMYFWAHNGTEAIPTWPGVSLQNDGNGWYSYTIDGASESNIIFSNNGSSQSADLNRTGNGWYKNGTWYAENPDSQAPSGLVIHYYNGSNWASPKMYFWAHDGTAAIPSWPGVSMQNDGNGWFSYSIAGASQSNIIFSNNGASQTADLNRTGEGWYKNGSWTSSQPSSQNGEKDSFVMNQESEIPSEFGISSVYPNPFNPSTTFKVKMAETGRMSLNIYSVMGQKIAEIANDKELVAGEHEFRFDAKNLASGTYLYVLQFNDAAKLVSGKIQLIK